MVYRQCCGGKYLTVLLSQLSHYWNWQRFQSTLRQIAFLITETPFHMAYSCLCTNIWWKDCDPHHCTGHTITRKTMWRHGEQRLLVRVRAWHPGCRPYHSMWSKRKWWLLAKKIDTKVYTIATSHWSKWVGNMCQAYRNQRMWNSCVFCSNIVGTRLQVFIPRRQCTSITFSSGQRHLVHSLWKYATLLPAILGTKALASTAQIVRSTTDQRSK